jgi:hypothetical protein
MKKKISWALLIIIVVIQFIRPGKNKAATVSANSISQHHVVPPEVDKILSRACNDCHSNNTNYPWYSNIQPVGWWLASHVKDGKNQLNFSEFAAYEPKGQHHKLEEIIEEVKEGHMPLDSYLWIHDEAKLTADEKKTLLLWASVLADQIAAKHKIDGKSERP